MRHNGRFAALAVLAAAAGCLPGTQGGDAPLICANTVRGNYNCGGETYFMIGGRAEVVLNRPTERRREESGGPLAWLGGIFGERSRRPEAADPSEIDCWTTGGCRVGWVSLGKQADHAAVQPPASVTFTVIWLNYGTRPAEHVLICDTISRPQVLEDVQAPGCRVELAPQPGGGTLIKIMPPTLKPGDSGQALIRVRIP